MALKILTRAEDMPDGKDNLEYLANTKWKRTIKIKFGLKQPDWLVRWNNLQLPD